MLRKILKNEEGLSDLMVALVLVVIASFILIFLMGGTEATKDTNVIKSSQDTTNTIIEVIKDINSTNH